VGVHSGPVIGGVIGHRKLAFDIWGETVNIASRLESQGQPGRVIVSAATWRSVEDLFDAEHSRPMHLRGYGPMDTYAIIGRRSGSLARAATARQVRSDVGRSRSSGGGARRPPIA
jgi:adenylate cyclase